MARGTPGLIGVISRHLGRFRGFFIPFGLFSLIAVGIHLGSDRADDAAFLVLNWVDSLFDRSTSWVVRGLWDAFGATPKATDGALFWVTELIDLDLKHQLARVFALVGEIVADVLVALPVFLFRERDRAQVGLVQRAFKDPTVLRFAAPLAAFMAAVAGCLVISREIQVASFGALRFLYASSSIATTVSGFVGIVALLLVTLRLAWVAVLAAERWANVRAELDAGAEIKPWRRRLRGAVTAVIGLPICFWAFQEAVRLGSELGTLLPT